MGAYLHLRLLAELDDISDCNIHCETLQHLNGPGCGSGEVMLTEATGAQFASIGCTKEINNLTTNEINDCLNISAGQLENIVEELQLKAGCQDSPRAKIGVNGRGQEDVSSKNPIERTLDRREKGNSNPRKSSTRQDTLTEIRAVDDTMHLVYPGNSSAGFHHRAAVASGSGASRGESPDYRGKGSASTDGHIREVRGQEDSGSCTHSSRGSYEDLEDQLEKLPDHLLIEMLVRVPARDWPVAACAKKRWAQLFKSDDLRHSALIKKWPDATSAKRWPGSIARVSSKRRYTSLYVSDCLFVEDNLKNVGELAGHAYLFLKEQLESPTPVSYGLLHRTIIDQFLACCKTGDDAHNLAAQIWIPILNNLDESEKMSTYS